MNNQRNIILAILLSALILFGWDYVIRHFYPPVEPPARQEQVEKQVETGDSAARAPAGKANRDGGLMDPLAQEIERRDLAIELKSPERVKIEAPGLSGSINLVGGVIDDITLNRYRETLEKNSGPVRIFSPLGTPAQQFSQFGWAAVGGHQIELPDSNTRWNVPENTRLTPEHPVTLSWDNPTGQRFEITYSIDRAYMISARQKVINRGDAPVAVRPFALINRTSQTASVDSFNVHSGPIGAFDGAVQFNTNYGDIPVGGVIDNAGKTNWLGFTDVYWMTALIPGKNEVSSHFRGLGNSLYRADVLYAPVIVGPGQELVRTTQLFAGAKEHTVLEGYEAQGITKFGLAIDWGWFRWFEKPIFWLLMALFRTVGNFGFAIILLTVIVRGIMFPVAQRQFASMAAMRAIQPKMKELQARYKDDKQKQQQEIMALYKKEGVNPLAGCLPIFLQLPIFFALYKTLILAIEMRHQPFVLWIKDLSAPDPLHVLNLFGLLPFTPPSFLGIGILALLLGFTMWLQFRLNPTSTDPIQQQMFMFMPWIMMFIMAPFAAGLLLYWVTSNILTIVQQSVLYSRHPQLKAQLATADSPTESKQKRSDGNKAKPAKTKT